MNKSKKKEVRRNQILITPTSLNILPAQCHKELVGWLLPTQHNGKHEEATSRWKDTGRCSWILENETFMQWRSDGGFLWLYGIRAYHFSILHPLRLTNHSAGSGKSTLMLVTTELHSGDAKSLTGV